MFGDSGTGMVEQEALLLGSFMRLRNLIRSPLPAVWRLLRLLANEHPLVVAVTHTR
jgi:hypothetical protein